MDEVIELLECWKGRKMDDALQGLYVHIDQTLVLHCKEKKNKGQKGKHISKIMSVAAKRAIIQRHKCCDQIYKMQKEIFDETGTRTQEDCSTRKLVLRLTLTWRHNQLGHLTENLLLSEETHKPHMKCHNHLHHIVVELVWWSSQAAGQLLKRHSGKIHLISNRIDLSCFDDASNGGVSHVIPHASCKGWDHCPCSSSFMVNTKTTQESGWPRTQLDACRDFDTKDQMPDQLIFEGAEP
jgi:hypothetical protein